MPARDATVVGLEDEVDLGAIVVSVVGLPGPETVTTRAVLDLLAEDLGHPVAVRSLPNQPLIKDVLNCVLPLRTLLCSVSWSGTRTSPIS
jgi:hypothetical protein